MQSNSTTDTFTLHTAPGDVTFTGNTVTIAFTGVTYEYDDPTPTTHEFTSLDASVTSTFTLTVNPPTGETLADTLAALAMIAGVVAGDASVPSRRRHARRALDLLLHGLLPRDPAPPPAAAR